jgi:hypothetical protein
MRRPLLEPPCDVQRGARLRYVVLIGVSDQHLSRNERDSSEWFGQVIRGNPRFKTSLSEKVVVDREKEIASHDVQWLEEGKDFDGANTWA